MRDIDQRAVRAAQDTEELNKLVVDYQGYIFKCASKSANRFLTSSDDEYSVALEAFCGAVTSYSFEKGSFLAFAELLIRRRLIDFYRTERKRSSEISVNPILFTGEIEFTEENPALASQIAAKTATDTDTTLKDEIDAANGQFAFYDFSFYDLITCSPKSRKTKEACRKAISFLVSSPLLRCELRRTGTLPLKQIEQFAGVSRKIMERHRKYVIAAVEILTGDYPGLAAYMLTLREDDVP